MKKLVLAVLLCFVSLLVFVSCQDKEILLPKAGETVVADVQDHSPIYLFFKTEEKDTLVEVNRKNSISSTNWLFHVDKRLPLRLVIPEVKKLQNKKGSSVHKNEASENYFTYTDTTKKTMAFMPFTKLHYKYEKPDKNMAIITFDENNLVHYKDAVFAKEELVNYLRDLLKGNRMHIIFAFSKKMTFEQYIQTKLFLKNLEIAKEGITVSNRLEYIY